MVLTLESEVRPYELPELLRFADGRSVCGLQDWIERRRELIHLFEEHVYGAIPQTKIDTMFELQTLNTQALHGLATQKQIRITFHNSQATHYMDLLVYLPNSGKQPHPLFIGLNFEGNHAIHSDPGIILSTSWMPDRNQGVVNHHATEASRGAKASRWSVEMLLEQGYGLATIYCGDLDPDFDDGFQNGVHPLFYKNDQTRPSASQWGTIATWAWGLSRAMDYFENDEQIDCKRVAVLGHSRLGKAALWAGALDERFAMVISNNSGCGGAALSRRKFGETVEAINTRFPHWFCENFKQYNDCEENLPLDQHMLLALIAPRPLYITSASEDLWADPRGEFLAACHASPAYELFEKTGLIENMKVEIESPIMNSIGYHIRNGVHDITAYDWTQFINFAKLHFT
jgi:hypothetical protein